MIAVIDTNVLVSGLLSPHGPPGRILDQVTAGRVEVAFDDRILHEYREVLQRPRLGIRPSAAHHILSVIEIMGRAVLAAPVAVLLPDPGDQLFVEVAAAAGAVPIVTGNRKHYAPAWVSFEILSPAEFLEHLR